MDTKDIFKNNKKWAQEQLKNNPKFFTSLSKQQHPNYLWIGCSDSRVPTNQIMNLPAGDVFVHRNIANIVAHTDFNCLSAIEYAVEVLKVEHIIVCGHYGCGGVKAAMDGNTPGYVGNWLSNIKDIIKLNKDELKDLNEQEKYNKVCELNVLEQVKNASSTTIVQNAWKNNANLTIHGWIYCISDGILHDLKLDKNTL
ncbi:MAG: carbonic anhydrase [Epsilonproteobacteria bacterium]|nr:MAG: carbonic anhydrase [Campylobacterota bacterium]